MSHRYLLIYAKNSFLIGWNFFHLTFHTRTWRINNTKLSPVFKSLKVISKPHVQYLFHTAHKFFEYFLVSSHENYKYKPIQVKIFPLNVNKYSNKDASVNVTRGQVLIPGVMSFNVEECYLFCHELGTKNSKKLLFAIFRISLAHTTLWTMLLQTVFRSRIEYEKSSSSLLSGWKSKHKFEDLRFVCRGRLFFRFKFQKSPFFNRWPRVEKFTLFLILSKGGVYYFIATKVIESTNF